METTGNNKIAFIKQIDVRIYDFFQDLLKSFFALSLENSFFIIYGALIEKTIYKFLEKQNIRIPRSLETGHSSFSTFIMEPDISSLLSDLGLDVRIAMYSNIMAISQRHPSSSTYKLSDMGLDSLKQEINKATLIKMYLFFATNMAFCLFSEKHEMLTDEEIAELLVEENKVTDYNEETKLIILDELKAFKVGKRELADLHCDGEFIQGYAGRNDIGFVSFGGTYTRNVKIGAKAFQNCSSLSKVDFHNVSAIYRQAFSGCINLKEIDLSKSNVYKIDGEAFEKCPLIKIVLPSDIRFIGFYAFGPELSEDCVIYFKGDRTSWLKIDIDSTYRYVLERRLKYLN